MGNCKACKHWGTLRHRVAEHVRHDFKRCERVEDSDMVSAGDHPAGSLYAIGTAADFGCVLWEAKT